MGVAVVVSKEELGLPVVSMFDLRHCIAELLQPRSRLIDTRIGQRVEALLQAAKDGPLHCTNVRAVAKSERLMIRNGGLGDNSGRNTTMGPCRPMYHERMAKEHIACLTGCVYTWALERRGGQLSHHFAKAHPSLSVWEQHARDIQMRSHD